MCLYLGVNVRRGQFRRAALERRGRGVFQIKLDRLCGVFAVQFGDQRQREIDAGGDAAAADYVAVARRRKADARCVCLLRVAFTPPETHQQDGGDRQRDKQQAGEFFVEAGNEAFDRLATKITEHDEDRRP